MSSPAPIKKVVVVGASGNIGLPITKALAASGPFAVSALTRPSSTPSAQLPSSVGVLRADYSDKQALVNALKGQDAVVCAIGTAQLGMQYLLIEAAAEAGVKRFIPSHWAFDSQREGFVEVAPVAALKEGPISKLKNLQSTGMSWTAIITGSWVDFFVSTPEFPFWDVSTKTFVKFDDGETAFSCSSVAQVGRMVVAVLSEEHVEKTKNQYVYVKSGRLTQNQVLQILERESGQKWTVVPNQAETLRLQGVAIWDKWTKEEGKSPEELSDNADFQMGVHMIVGGLIMGKWGAFDEKAEVWMSKVGVAEEDIDALMSKATREAIASSS